MTVTPFFNACFGGLYRVMYLQVVLVPAWWVLGSRIETVWARARAREMAKGRLSDLQNHRARAISNLEGIQKDIEVALFLNW